MGEVVQTRFIFLIEKELRLAARAVRSYHKLYESPEATEDALSAAAVDVLNTASAALWHLDDETLPLILTSADRVFEPTTRPQNHETTRPTSDTPAAQKPNGTSK